ncbi:MAG: hypothetical protein AABY75_00155 [Bacteroidota bacterium]
MEDLLVQFPSLRRILPAVAALAVAVFFIRTASHFAYTPDDAYIYLRTASNIVQGDGLSFNPGEPSYSVTGPLWALLIAAGTGIGLDPYVAAKGLDLTFAAIAIMVFQLLVVTVTGDRVLSVVGAVMLTVDAWALRWAGSGLETSLALLLTIVAFRYVLMGEWLLTAAAAGLLVLLRPENILLVPWLVVATYDGDWRVHARRWAWPVTIVAAIAGGWWAFAFLTFGDPFPTTFAGKAAGVTNFSDMAAALWDSIRVAAVTQGSVVLVMVGLLLWFRGCLRGMQGRLLIVLVGWPVFLTFVYAMQGVQVVSRYLVPVLPLLTAGALLTISWLRVQGSLSLRRTVSLTATMTLLTIVVNTTVYETSISPHLRDFSVGMQQAMKPIAYWIRSHTKPEDEVLAPDVGMVGYLGRRRVWDPAGLATPGLRRALDGHSYDEIMTKGLYRSVVNPRYVIDRSRQKERLASATMRPILTAEFAALDVSIPGTQYVTRYEAWR